ncbi:MAG: AIPR family protein [Vallitaleaceae bacterium]|nr:AIPR family protein [Vallitaleaceae bacterium]
MNLDDFTKDFIEDIRNDSIIGGVTPATMFLETMVAHLEEMEYVFNPTILPFYKSGSSNRIMKFDLFAFDETDKSLVLLSNEYNDDIGLTLLNQAEINQVSKRMLNYLDEIYTGNIFRFVDPSQDAYGLAIDLKERLTRTYVDLKNDIGIEKIKLFIITNKRISNRVSNLKLEEFHDKQVELNVWDIERIFDIINSGKDKEPIIVNLNRLNNGQGIPFLKADFGTAIDYDAYLCILPGKLLSDIYWDHGSRLLEGNVRAFLSNRGNVNKGIRNTINKDPGKFFTYNNGIACTAKNIIFSENGQLIDEIEDLQIINGGQTTASLTSAWKKDKATLEKIYVPMKLTIIKSHDYDDMVQNISRYANSQNKVTDADLFSNHPFHRKMERMSLKHPAPPKSGETHNTFWYYERSRGKYQQSQFKLQKQSQIKAFKEKYPKKQVIVKEDLAKYIMSGEYIKPYLVSRGRARNMNEFAKIIDKQWKKDSTVFNEAYFKRSVCYAILFKTVDLIVKHADWYNVGGLKLNIIPYTISKIVFSIPSNMTLDFNRIWRKQDLYESLVHEINRVSRMANDFLNDSKGVIPTEYAKKEETWNTFKSMPLTLSSNFVNDLMKKSLVEEQDKIAGQDEKLDENVNLEIQVFNLAQTENGDYWRRLTIEGIERGIISQKEEAILRNYIWELSKKVPKRLPSPAQYRIAWTVRKKLEDAGVFV